VLPSRLILFDLTFSLVPDPLLLLASVAFKVSYAAVLKLLKDQDLGQTDLHTEIYTYIHEYIYTYVERKR
jgi:hypothetical protein